MCLRAVRISFLSHVMGRYSTGFGSLPVSTQRNTVRRERPNIRQTSSMVMR